MTNLTNSALENLFDSTLVAAQQPQWPDKSALDEAVAELKDLEAELITKSAPLDFFIG